MQYIKIIEVSQLKTMINIHVYIHKCTKYACLLNEPIATLSLFSDTQDFIN